MQRPETRLKTEPIANHRMRQMYQRTLTYWASDLLPAPRPQWPASDPMSDYRNRDWHLLYNGSVLDD